MAGTLQEKNLFLAWSKNFFLFSWKLEEKDYNNDYKFESSTFSIGGEKDSYLSIKFKANSVMFLRLHNPVCVEGHFVIVILDAANTVIHSYIKSNHCFEISSAVELLSEFDILPLSTKFPVIVTCMWKGSNDCVSNIPNRRDSVLLNNLKELSSDFKIALSQDKHSDVILKVGESNIKAHKMILQARSPVFKKMFDSDFQEATANTVAISDVGAATIEKLMCYLYTGTVEKCNFEETLELYGAADKYEVLSLRDNCKMELLDLLQVDNACLIFALANRHCDEELKERVVQFISADYYSVVETDSFGELNKDDLLLLTRLCVSVMKNKK